MCVIPIFYVYSSNEQLPGIHHWPLALGRFFNAAEDESLAPVVVLGHKARQQFFRDEPNPLGKQLLVGDAPFEVIGVMAEKGKESGADYYDEMRSEERRVGKECRSRWSP